MGRRRKSQIEEEAINEESGVEVTDDTTIDSDTIDEVVEDKKETNTETNDCAEDLNSEENEDSASDEVPMDDEVENSTTPETTINDSIITISSELPIYGVRVPTGKLDPIFSDEIIKELTITSEPLTIDISINKEYWISYYRSLSVLGLKVSR